MKKLNINNFFKPLILVTAIMCYSCGNGNKKLTQKNQEEKNHVIEFIKVDTIKSTLNETLAGIRKSENLNFTPKQSLGAEGKVNLKTAKGYVSDIVQNMVKRIDQLSKQEGADKSLSDLAELLINYVENHPDPKELYATLKSFKEEKGYFISSLVDDFVKNLDMLVKNLNMMDMMGLPKGLEQELASIEVSYYNQLQKAGFDEGQIKTIFKEVLSIMSDKIADPIINRLANLAQMNTKQNS